MPRPLGRGERGKKKISDSRPAGAVRPSPAQRKIVSLIFRRVGTLPEKRRRSVRAVEFFALPLQGAYLLGNGFSQRVALGWDALPLRGDCRNNL
ncbi:MAG: hypothetical protein LBP75_08075 [Planctomycetota bacterium]|nr:hypothetical protein [Planctomycetota bacterium]